MVKKEKIIDLGMFGKWGESTLRQQLTIRSIGSHYCYELDYSSPLWLKIDSMRPKKLKTRLFISYQYIIDCIENKKDIDYYNDSFNNVKHIITLLKYKKIK